MDTQQVSAPPRAPSRDPHGLVPSGVVHINSRHTERFTVVGNHLAQHRGLSLVAIALAVHIQSLPAGSRIGVKVLSDRFPESETRIAAALRELEAHGYLRRTRERLPNGRVVTRTVSYNQPGTGTSPGRGPAPTAATTDVQRPSSALSLASLSGRPSGRPSGWLSGRPSGWLKHPHPHPPEPVLSRSQPEPRTQPPPLPPRRAWSASSNPGSAQASVPAVDATPAPVPGGARAQRRSVPPRRPLPRPSVSDVERHRAATDLLAGLRRDDARLLLAEPDVRRLAPAVEAWLERDAHPDAVRTALTTDLPGHLRQPAAFLAHRLAESLPPPLPAVRARGGAGRPDPLQNCDVCDHAFRSPEPGRCRDCRDEHVDL
ncbi:helix-turn-helix domain-containing protein [Streptomyces sp. NBC_00859]|uniref:helix-turn-helix domain-containing protein n=1 Tax=Streptomyces sp. NBC_00859 TaxID=2903682 RepID=UPI00386B0CF1|nr:helix-turn-helix domain-containing protein [Streptomyces sp. NBC_00859]